MILQAKIIKETEKATLFKIYDEHGTFCENKWIPNSVILDIEVNKKESTIIEVDIADWFCEKEGLDII